MLTGGRQRTVKVQKDLPDKLQDCKQNPEACCSKWMFFKVLVFSCPGNEKLAVQRSTTVYHFESAGSTAKIPLVSGSTAL